MKSFIFYASYFEALRGYPKEMQKNTFFNLINYAMTGKLPTKMSKDEKLAFTLIQPIIEKSLKKSNNGKKGGAPKGNKNAVKSKDEKNKQKTSKKQADIYQDKIFEPTNQRLFGDILVGKHIKKLTGDSRARANKTVENLQKRFETTLQFYKNTEFETVFNFVFESFAYIVETAPKKFNGKNYNKQKLKNILDGLTEERLLSIVKTVKFSSDIQDTELYFMGCLLNSQQK